MNDMLVLNRKFDSDGTPYWSCEMRFDDYDTEQRDDSGTREEALANCMKFWGFAYSYPVTVDDDLSPGQHVYSLSAEPQVLL
jgi:hypothetical protein